ncbi:unnamed protein product [Sphenostylis stenocarpa]|uniref:Uncharacterized protein n=1 Tax=Sphenostylis stenocarpa TaxID=92480 RepID=A0AA86SVJ4_9FABA|nr:unnamed protein product [Sphenostylis stenocarpa]
MQMMKLKENRSSFVSTFPTLLILFYPSFIIVATFIVLRSNHTAHGALSLWPQMATPNLTMDKRLVNSIKVAGAASLKGYPNTFNPNEDHPHHKNLYFNRTHTRHLIINDSSAPHVALSRSLLVWRPRRHAWSHSVRALDLGLLLLENFWPVTERRKR